MHEKKQTNFLHEGLSPGAQFLWGISHAKTRPFEEHRLSKKYPVNILRYVLSIKTGRSYERVIWLSH